MKNLKNITGIALLALFSFTSCQSEVDSVEGQKNTNAPNSTFATNLKRTSLYDGSKDDVIDGNSCSSIMFPATVKVNGIQVSLLSEISYQQVISIFGQSSTDQDTVVLQFPLKLKMSDYTEVTVNSQSEYNAIVNSCSAAESASQNAISSIDISFPITLLSYNISLEQTGSVVIKTEKELYMYMSSMSSTELFSVKYPIQVTTIDEVKTTVSSDAELQSTITASLQTQAAMDVAVENSAKLETILVNGVFKVQSFVTAGVETATNYKDFTVDFANDNSIKVMNTLTTAATGTYALSSELNVFLKLNFTGNTTVALLNNDWKVSSFTTSSITLESKTNAAVKLVLKQI